MFYESALKNRNIDFKPGPELTPSAEHFVNCAVLLACCQRTRIQLRSNLSFGDSCAHNLGFLSSWAAMLAAR